MHDANVSSLLTYSVDEDPSSDLIDDDEDYLVIADIRHVVL